MITQPRTSLSINSGCFCTYNEAEDITVINLNMLRHSRAINRPSRSSPKMQIHPTDQYKHKNSCKGMQQQTGLNQTHQNQCMQYSLSQLSASPANQSQFMDKQNRRHLANQNSSELGHDLNTGQKVKLRGMHRRANTQTGQSNTVFKTECEKIRTEIMKASSQIIPEENIGQFSSAIGLRAVQLPEKNMVQSERHHGIGSRMIRQISDLRKSAQLNSSSFFESSFSDESMTVCVNHVDKKAKYRVEDHVTVYCSKCAVSLLQKGYRIQELRSASLSRRISKSGSRVRQSRTADISNLQSAINKTKLTIQSSRIPNECFSSLNKLKTETQKAYHYIDQQLREMKARDLQKINSLILHKHSQQNERNRHYLQSIILLKQGFERQKKSIMAAKQTEFNKVISNNYEQLAKIEATALKVDRVPLDYQQSSSESFKERLEQLVGQIKQRISHFIVCSSFVNEMQPANSVKAIERVQNDRGQSAMQGNDRGPKAIMDNYIYLENDHGTPSFRKSDRRAIR